MKPTAKPQPPAPPPQSLTRTFADALDRPAPGPMAFVLAAGLFICPFILFYHPYGVEIFTNPITDHRLQSDDFAYIAASRTFPRAVASLFVPHNAHVIPSWRITTWLLVAIAGKLSAIPYVFGICTYLILCATMLLTGGFLARETGSALCGFLGACLVGITSVQFRAGTWFSAGQPLWAGLGILGSLWFAQDYRRAGRARSIALATLSACLAGGFWTIGHAAGPVAAAYLWAAGTRRDRRASWIPMAASIACAAGFLALGIKALDVTVSTNGRTALEAIRFDAGLMHTLRAIPENLFFANLGQDVMVAQGPGAVLTLAVVAVWARLRLLRRRALPAEIAGLLLVFLSYFVEMSFRGYSPFSSIRGWVPWYDAIPQIGLVLWLVCWAFGGGRAQSGLADVRTPLRYRDLGLVLAVALGLLVLHAPRSDALFVKTLPPMSLAEWERLPVLSLQRMRAEYLLVECASAQKRHLARYELAEKEAKRLGIGREAIKKAFGWTTMPELPDAYDGADMLNIPEHGPLTDPVKVRQALSVLLEYQPEPRHLPEESLRSMPVRRRAEDFNRLPQRPTKKANSRPPGHG